MAAQHDRLVTLTTAADELEGELIVALLKEHGIKATSKQRIQRFRLNNLLKVRYTKSNGLITSRIMINEPGM